MIIILFLSILFPSHIFASLHKLLLYRLSLPTYSPFIFHSYFFPSSKNFLTSHILPLSPCGLSLPPDQYTVPYLLLRNTCLLLSFHCSLSILIAILVFAVMFEHKWRLLKVLGDLSHLSNSKIHQEHCNTRCSFKKNSIAVG